MNNWFGNLNFYILQWFFVRLMKVTDAPTGRVSWHLSGFYMPMTGWLRKKDIPPGAKTGPGMKVLGKRWWLPRVKK